MCTKFANEWFKNANYVIVVSIFSADDMDIYISDKLAWIKNSKLSDTNIASSESIQVKKTPVVLEPMTVGCYISDELIRFPQNGD